jgi:cation diffusion facilitator family transporter
MSEVEGRVGVEEAAGERLPQIRRVLWFVFVANLFVVLVKVLVGLRAGSLAVLGDAAHSGVDAMNNVVGLLAVNVAAAPPDEEHPYGHGKYETLAALAVVSFLSITGFELVSSAVGRLLGSAAAPRIDPLTFALLAGTMLVNTVVAVSEARAARRLRSPVLSADARHTAADVLITLSVIGGLGLVALGWTDADAWLAILVAGLIARSGWEILKGTIPVLVDSRAIEAGRIRRFIGPVNGVMDVTEVRSRGDLATEAFTELTVIVDGGITVERGHAIADEVERKLLDAGFTRAVVHVEPAADEARPAAARETAR